MYRTSSVWRCESVRLILNHNHKSAPDTFLILFRTQFLNKRTLGTKRHQNSSSFHRFDHKINFHRPFCNTTILALWFALCEKSVFSIVKTIFFALALVDYINVEW